MESIKDNFTGKEQLWKKRESLRSFRLWRNGNYSVELKI